MGLIILAFVACLHNGQQCRKVEIPLEGSNVGLFTCLQGGQTEMAHWVLEHPGYEASRWTCSLGSSASERPA
jgi:hypothetical protein